MDRNKIVWRLILECGARAEFYPAAANYYLTMSVGVGECEILPSFSYYNNPGCFCYFNTREEAIAAIQHIGVDKLKKYYFEGQDDCCYPELDK
jgi:hypothetical protein